MSSGDSSSPPDSANDGLDQILAEIIRAEEAGESVDRRAILAAHPHFAAELREFFAQRGRFQQLAQPLRNVAARVLRVRCPHCRNPIQLLDEAPLAEISCPSCGSSFSLVTDASTAAYPGGIKTLGHFELLDQVGVGAFGSVWKARDTQLDRTVAVKIPRHGQLGETQTELFLRDARAAAQLKHPHIVSVHEIGRQDDTIYIVSDFIQGATLKEWTAAKRLTPREAAELSAKLAKALHHAHEAGVIHRDLKPGNIMMDADGQPHIVDFGLAKREAGEITMTVEGQILGTPAYMSPEQARGEGHKVDGRADIYSLGVILFELLTGELPFRGEKKMLIVQIVNDDPPNPRKLNSNVPRDLETICLKCLEKEQNKRYADSAELAYDFERWFAGHPIVARRNGPLVRTIKWARRKPAVTALFAVSSLAAVLLIGVLFISNLLIATALDDRTDALERVRIEEGKKREALADLTQAHLELRKKELETREALARESKALAAEQRRGYERSVLLAYQEWRNNNLSRAIQMLDDCPRELRGFEWRYLMRQCDHPGLLSVKHFSIVNSSIRGRGADRLIGRYGERVVRVSPLNDAAKGQGRKLTLVAGIADNLSELRSIVMGFSPSRVVISPTGEQVAVAKQNFPGRLHPSEVTVWETQTGDVLGRFTLPAHLDLKGMAISPDGERLATASMIWKENRGGGCDVRLWAIAEGTEVGKLPERERGGYFVRFSSDGKHLLANSRVWNIETLSDSFTLPPGFSPVDLAGRFVITRGPNDLIAVRDLETGSLVRSLAGNTSSVSAVAVTSNGDRLATNAGRGTVKIWDVATGREIRHLRSRFGIVSEMAFTRDGNKLIVLYHSYEQNVLKVWDCGTPQEAIVISGGKRRQGFAIAYDQVGQRVAWVAEDSTTINVTDVHRAVQTKSFTDNSGEVFGVTFHPRGTEVASAGYNGVKIWRLDSGDLVRELKMPEGLGRGSGYMIRVSYNHDGSMIAAAHSSGATIWDAASGQVKMNFPVKDGEPWFCSAEFDSVSKRLLIFSGWRRVAIHVLDTKTKELDMKLRRVGAARTAVFSNDGKRFAIAGGRSAKVFETASGKELLNFVGHTEGINTVDFSRDGRRFLTASRDQTVKVWDAKTGNELLTLSGHSGAVYSAVFAPDSSKIVSCGADGTIRIWDGTPLSKH